MAIYQSVGLPMANSMYDNSYSSSRRALVDNRPVMSPMRAVFKSLFLPTAVAVVLSGSSVVLAASQCSSPWFVQKGDTLSAIAQQCGTSVNALLQSNPRLSNTAQISVGEQINITGNESPLMSAQDLEKLLAPIALYPDVLLGEILPAATYPIELVQAARWVQDNPDAEPTKDQDWAESVKALTYYPEVLATLNSDLDWTVQLGEAFLNQPASVFDSIQALRQRADEAGNLKDNSLQNIVRESSDTNSKEIIRVVHADPSYVYVPVYDPYAVYQINHGHRYSSNIHFGSGLLLGGWLHHGLDWHLRNLIYLPLYSLAYNRFYLGGDYSYRRVNRRTIIRHGQQPYYGQRWQHDSRRRGSHRGQYKGQHNGLNRFSNRNNRYSNNIGSRRSNNNEYRGRNNSNNVSNNRANKQANQDNRRAVSDAMLGRRLQTTQSERSRRAQGVDLKRSQVRNTSIEGRRFENKKQDNREQPVSRRQKISSKRGNEVVAVQKTRTTQVVKRKPAAKSQRVQASSTQQQAKAIARQSRQQGSERNRQQQRSQQSKARSKQGNRRLQ